MNWARENLRENSVNFGPSGAALSILLDFAAAFGETGESADLRDSVKPAIGALRPLKQRLRRLASLLPGTVPTPTHVPRPQRARC